VELQKLREVVSKVPSTVRVLLFITLAFLFFAGSFSSYFVSDDYLFLGQIHFDNASQYFTKSMGCCNEYRPLTAYSYAPLWLSRDGYCPAHRKLPLGRADREEVGRAIAGRDARQRSLSAQSGRA
jgi:hypothetical protein